MSVPLEKVEAEALELPPRERALLARRLIASLDRQDDSPDVELAWEEEIHRRVEEHRSGAVQAVPASEVFARAHARLR
jgi:putative addiction module component (TIGR02574 family)